MSAENDTVWPISIFLDKQIAGAFACVNCHNVPRQVINDADNKNYCEHCVAQLRLAGTRANTAIDAMINKLKVKCPNVNTKYNEHDDNDDDHKQDNNKKECEWSGTVDEWLVHNNADCAFASITCKYCGKYQTLRYLMESAHQSQCDEVAIECELNCGTKLFRKEMKAHLLNDCKEQTQTCEQCNRSDIKRKELEKHALQDCEQRPVVCKYASYGCDVKNVKKGELERHYQEYGVYHTELKMNAVTESLREELKNLEKKITAQNKSIEHLKYRNSKLQMQIHQKETLRDDFLIVFESDLNKNSFVSSVNFKYNSSMQNHHLIKPLSWNKEQIIYKRVKDCSYCFGSNVYIDQIIGITSKSKQQHIQSCVSTLSSKCICTFNVIYRVGGDTVDVNENNNICNVLGTDVVFQLPQLLMSRFNHRAVYSKIHGILAVGGEPIKKEDMKKELKQIDKENEENKRKVATSKENKNRKAILGSVEQLLLEENKRKAATSKDNKNRKAILGSVEQLLLAPNMALSHYYQVRNAGIKKDEEKLQMPPEPELKWRNLAAPMKYRRDCPSVGLFRSGQKYEEQLFVAGGWNEKDLNYVELYNFKSREWKTLSPLNVKRNSAGMCEWKQKNHNMVIVGGWNKKTVNSVEEWDAHKNKWYVLNNTNHPHRYYPACTVYHDLNPFINSGYGVIVVMGNDGRLYGDEFIKKQQSMLKKKNQQNDINIDPNVAAKEAIPPSVNTLKEDWGFIEFYDPRDWIRKWTVIDNVPSFLNLTDDECKQLYFQSVLACPHNVNSYAPK
eukprot:CAMPEP_0197076944 /NCGR_PEP_ID=MMETSP1384-20130603/212367_1 /TAXON_ID=29189 /ORGANISM="Ammonia sp." /LENGTH=786 /DNA_ID=CAMNT_0042515803 /DNA_START=21 /DNA_END=2381 /DNA_ORIENTATION=-